MPRLVRSVGTSGFLGAGVLRFFFYGTLLDRDIREIVLPHLGESLRLVPGELRGFRRVASRDGPYPVLVPHPNGRVRGRIAEGLDLPGLARAAHFEGDLYRPVVQTVRDRGNRPLPAWVFVPENPRLQGSRQSWDLGFWQRRHKRRMLLTAERWMAEFGAKGFYGGDLSWRGRRTLLKLAEEHRDAPAGEAAFRLDEAA
jgi:hypothetical protein